MGLSLLKHDQHDRLIKCELNTRHWVKITATVFRGDVGSCYWLAAETINERFGVDHHPQPWLLIHPSGATGYWFILQHHTDADGHHSISKKAPRISTWSVEFSTCCETRTLPHLYLNRLISGQKRRAVPWVVAHTWNLHHAPSTCFLNSYAVYARERKKKRTQSSYRWCIWWCHCLFSIIMQWEDLETACLTNPSALRTWSSSETRYQGYK